MRILVPFLAMAGGIFAQTVVQTGPDVGTVAPEFTATDQNGVARSSKSLMGPAGLMLVFFRSADW